MIEMLYQFYNYCNSNILLFIIICFIYILHLLKKRHSNFKYVEDEFKKNIQVNIKDSSEKIEKFQTRALEKIDYYAQNNIRKTLTRLATTEELLVKINLQLSELQKNNHELQKENTNLLNDIHQKDAIIERKIKQLKRLKNAV